MQLLDIGFRSFPHAAPHNGATLVMDLQHVFFGSLPRVSKDLLEDSRNVAHQVHGVIVNHHIPGNVDLLLGLG